MRIALGMEVAKPFGHGRDGFILCGKSPWLNGRRGKRADNATARPGANATGNAPKIKKEMIMKKTKFFFSLLGILLLMGIGCAEDSKSSPSGLVPESPSSVGNAKSKSLVVYFSWGGTTKRLAEMISERTGADLFRIEPAEAYPESYTPCTEVAKVELEQGIYRGLKVPLPSMENYDTIFVGTPVWWHTAAMIVQGAIKDVDFSGKTVIPFCTYAATYRDETLSKIVELTSGATHLEGYGTTSPNEDDVREWLNSLGISKNP